MTMANAMKMTMTTAGRKQKSLNVVGVVVWDFGMRKRKILNKWRMIRYEINWKRKI
ncbi:hypothetical protein [Geobacillus sp. YHL]|uniref:hypothetical protein n=1 Tax=Geobacillus sp. YHL TaxID=2796117 RepID=UPI001EF0FE5F|nr:hypothetical protein [Geobacillus sp. YHL]MCG6793831.1 hypothetical protein [Geobacillus sp. YHL]